MLAWDYTVTKTGAPLFIMNLAIYKEKRLSYPNEDQRHAQGTSKGRIAFLPSLEN